jgi:hypothetical protein
MEEPPSREPRDARRDAAPPIDAATDPRGGSSKFRFMSGSSYSSRWSPSLDIVAERERGGGRREKEGEREGERERECVCVRCPTDYSRGPERGLGKWIQLYSWQVPKFHRGMPAKRRASCAAFTKSPTCRFCCSPVGRGNKDSNWAFCRGM